MLAEHEIVVDCFAGGGGASLGLARALGRVDVAINHSAAAIAVHTANHPAAKHYLSDIWEVDPVEACAGRPVGHLHLSPDCTHFSRAKGGKPRSKKVRSLAWVAVRWAKAVRPRVITIENVEEFVTWGPLDEHGQPRARDAGRTFREFVAKLRRLGYAVEWRLLTAADYGAPTTRRRLFLVARCDGQPIRWPAPTHGKGRAPWRTAAEIIDWSIPCPSIFDRKRPLAEATLRRIAAGVRRFVIEAAQPFIVPVTHPRDARVHALTEPLRTVTAANRGELALIAPTLVQIGYGERPGQAPRVPGLDKPLGTVVCDQKHGLVAALITKHYGGVVGHQAELPLGTITAKDHHAVTAAFLTKFYGTAVGASAAAPLPTVTGGGQHLAAVRAFLVKYYQGGAEGDGGSQQQSLFGPLHTVTTKARFGLVTVHGETYQIADIGMRMLAPRELFRAQGFPDAYVIDAPLHGKPLTKTAQIELAGNSVCPDVMAALVGANHGGGARERAVA
jgi:DNA (cytosine-5)-methyltransferase 1